MTGPVTYAELEVADARVDRARGRVVAVASRVVRARGAELERALDRLAVAVEREETATARRNELLAAARVHGLVEERPPRRRARAG